MRIGFDVQFLRHSRSGIGSYIRHVYDWLCRLSSCQVLPFCYGPPSFNEPKEVRLLEQLWPAHKLNYYWDGPPFHLLSHYFTVNAAPAPWFARAIDRQLLLPLWQRLATIEADYPKRSRWINRLWQQRSLNRVDLYHHTGPIVLPPHKVRGNVLTVYDVGTLRVPQFQCQENIGPWNETLGLASQMDGLIAISEHTKREIVALLGIAPEIIDVTPLAAHEQYRPIADCGQIQSVLSKYELLGRPYIIHVGTLEPRKNLPRLIEAFHDIKQHERGLPHQLLLVGETGWMYERIFETIQRLQIESQVRWLKYVPFEEMPALLNGADLLVYPSFYEGFGLPPLEAMSCGTPVIASNTTSLPEVVGDAGLLVDPERVEDIAAAMARVLKDPTLQGTLRAKGLARAKLFSWERTARLTLTAYGRAYRRSRNRGRNRPRVERPRTKGHEFQREWIIGNVIEDSLKVTSP